MAGDREKEKVMAALLKRKRAWPSVSPADECPDASILAAYFDRSLSPPEVEQWENHFSLCSRCQEQMAILVSSEPTAGAVPTPKRSASAWLLNWRFLAPASAAAVVLLVVVVLQQTTMRKPAPTESYEAQAKSEDRNQAPAAARTAQPAESAATSIPSSAPAGAKEAARDNALRISPSKLAGKLSAEKAGAQGQPAPDEIAKNVQPAPPTKGERDELTRRMDLHQGTAEGVTGAVSPARAPAAPVAEIRAKEQQQVVAMQAPAQENELLRAGARPAPAQTQIGAEKKEAVAQPAGEIGSVAQTEPTGQKKLAAAKDLKKSAADSVSALGPAPQMRSDFASAGGRFTVISTDGKTLWRIGPAGLIERSQDGGKEWTRQRSPSQGDILAGSAPSATVCWLGGRKGLLLRTTDGYSWTKLSSPTAADIVAIRARDSLDVSITTAEGRIYDTADGGRTWTPR